MSWQAFFELLMSVSVASSWFSLILTLSVMSKSADNPINVQSTSFFRTLLFARGNKIGEIVIAVHLKLIKTPTATSSHCTGQQNTGKNFWDSFKNERLLRYRKIIVYRKLFAYERTFSLCGSSKEEANVLTCYFKIDLNIKCLLWYNNMSWDCFFTFSGYWEKVMYNTE